MLNEAFETLLPPEHEQKYQNKTVSLDPGEKRKNGEIQKLTGGFMVRGKRQKRKVTTQRDQVVIGSRKKKKKKKNTD